MNAPAKRFGAARGLLLLVAIPILVIAVAWIVLRVAFPPAKVRAIVSAQLSTALARPVKFEGASIELFPPVRLRVTNLELAEPEGFERGAAMRAQSLDLDLDPFALLGRRIEVRRLALESPAIHLVLHPDGTTNFEGLTKPDKPGAKARAPMDLEVRGLTVHGGQLLVDDLKAARRIKLGLETQLSFSSVSAGTRLTTDGITTLSELGFGPLSAARISDLDNSLAKLRWRIEHRGAYDTKQKRLALEKLALSFGKAELAFSGLVDGLGATAEPGKVTPPLRVDLNAKGNNVDFGEVLRYLSVADAPAVAGIHGAGSMSFDLGIRGALGGAVLPAITGTLAVRDGSFRYPGAPASVEAIAFHATFTPDAVRVPDLTARVAQQPIRATLQASRFADPIVNASVQGNLDLAVVGPMIAPKDTKLTGRAAVDVRAHGRAKDPGELVLDGRANLTDVTVERAGLPKKVEGVNGAIEFTAARATIRGLTARAGKSSFVVDAIVTRPLALMAKPDEVPPAGADFDFRSPYLDLAELLPTTPGAPFLPNARGGGRVAIGRLIQGRLDVDSVHAQVTLTPAALDANSFAMRGYGGRMNGSAKIDLHDTRKPRYSVDAKVISVQVNDLLSAWTPAKNLIQGTLSTSIDMSGEGLERQQVQQTLTLIALAALTEGKLGPGPSFNAVADFVRVPALKEVQFHDLKLPVRIERGRVVTDAVSLTGPSGDWKLAGSVGFDGQLDYAVSVTLPPQIATALRAQSAIAAGALSDDQGRLLLDLRVTGPARAPRVAWDAKAMRDRLLGRASEALLSQRQRLEDEARAIAQQRMQATTDSARTEADRRRHAVSDSLRSRAGGLIDRFFGGGARDTTKK